MYLSFYLPLYSAEFVSKTHFVYKVAFFFFSFFKQIFSQVCDLGLNCQILF